MRKKKNIILSTLGNMEQDKIEISYGIKTKKIVVTEKAFTLLNDNGIITIPRSDTIRDSYFTDPVPMLKKNVFITINGLTTSYDQDTKITIDTINNTFTVNDRSVGISYGISTDSLDVTEKVFVHLNNDGIIIIPMHDHKRTSYFSDPHPMVEKSIFITMNGITTEYNQHKKVTLDTKTNLITINDIHDRVRNKKTSEPIHQELGDVNKNTVLIVEPRLLDHLADIIEAYYDLLKDKWNYVFYCGKVTKELWTKILAPYVELRELEVDNFNKPSEYSAFFKTSKLWEDLCGDFILTVQDDTWPTNTEPYTIDYFIRLNKSYIGGNMNFRWNELARENISLKNYNLNGGLSLRKRLDMIRIIKEFPDKHNDAEDVFFSLGCHKLGLPMGDNEDSTAFAIHYVYKKKFFGIHKPSLSVKQELNKYNKELLDKHPYLFLLI
jgi:hypothetical protein